ncbi:MAG: hypothetical protein WB644_02550 [Candidatus Cybelea sp.]
MTRGLTPHQHITVISAAQRVSRVESARIELAARWCVKPHVDTIETPHRHADNACGCRN